MEIRDIALNGVEYPATDLPDDQRLELVKAQLAKGNQKSALTPEAIQTVTNLIRDDIVKGYALVVTTDCLLRLTQAEVYPMGVQYQQSINELGETIPKLRLTHNLSANKKQGTSINQRVDPKDLPPTVYGYAIIRFLHLIHHIRWNNPNERILTSKSDIDKAYRRIHTSAKTASKCCASYFTPEDKDVHPLSNRRQMGTITTRIAFGGRPGPSYFSQISEPTFDLTSDLIECENWDPATTPFPLMNLIREPERMSDETPFGDALEADVTFPRKVTAGVEGYIDDSATAVLDSLDNAKEVIRAKSASLMALHLTFRPSTDKLEPLPRPIIASKRKIEAEGILREQITFLGWAIDSRAFTISLPEEKAANWIHTIAILLNKASTNYDELATLVGRLNHACVIIPTARHFINRLRRLMEHADKFRSASITDEAKADLRLWIEFMQYASNGISINSVIFRKPTTIVLTDASEMGIGGYSPMNNILWRYQFTADEATTFTLNVKEYIAAIIGALLALEADDCNFPCVLSLSDSSSVVSWLHKSNHDPNSSPIHNELARWHARTLMKFNACDYSQHIAGAENHVADSLSRDFHLPNDKLLGLFKTVCPHLLPPNPQIITIPSRLISKIATRLQHNHRELQLQLRPSTIARGISGWNSAEKGSLPTPIWETSPKSIGPVSYAHSWMRCATEPSPKSIQLRQIPRERQSIMWLRPSSRVIGQTQD